ncbi:MAG: hypothetical protein SFY67_05545 [Candidatus Melainabacteria bacterium]|nr:hypothetical protein [Candidatus Melainabacteria bacterium]
MLSLIEGNWLSDLCSEARLLLLLPLGFTLIFSLLRNNAAIAFCSTVLVSIICYQTLFGQGHALDKCDLEIKAKPEQQISILNFNTEYQHNNKIESFIAYCKKMDPDVVVLTEADEKWTRSMEKLEYPSTMSILRRPGFTVMSKYASRGAQIYYPGGSQPPQVHILIDKNNQTINIVALHLSAMQTPIGYDFRKKEFAVLKDRLEKMPYPTIILGDTNSSNWSSSVKSFLKDANLKDTQAGFMTVPTWPARSGKLIANVAVPPFVAIDNVFVSKDFDVLERRVGPALGSNHMPVYVKLQLNQKAKQQE